MDDAEQEQEYAEIRQERQRLREAEDALTARTMRAIAANPQRSLRDLGALLGISYQRVDQIRQALQG